MRIFITISLLALIIVLLSFSVSKSYTVKKVFEDSLEKDRMKYMNEVSGFYKRQRKNASRFSI